MIPKEQKDKILELWAQGAATSTIAQETETTPSAVASVVYNARKAGDKRAVLRDKRARSPRQIEQKELSHKLRKRQQLFKLYPMKPGEAAELIEKALKKRKITKCKPGFASNPIKV